MGLLDQVKAFVFDAYGTIFDLASAVARCPSVPDDKRIALSALWREKQLQYTWLRSLEGHYVDFEIVTRDALDFSLDTLDLRNLTIRYELLALYFTLSPFPEVRDVLQTLRSKGFVTAILSNGSPHMLSTALKHAGLTELFDHVLSVDAVKVFKTHPRAYQYCLDTLSLSAEQISFQSSNAWDAYAASAFGMRVVWCNRYQQKPERLPGKPDFEIRNLAELRPLVA